MVQNTSRALPGSFNGGRSTIAEKSQRSRGSMAMGWFSLFDYPHSTLSPRHPEVRVAQAFACAQASKDDGPDQAANLFMTTREVCLRVALQAFEQNSNRPSRVRPSWRTPTLHLALGRDRVGDRIEML